jgi:hypothetical protein
LNLPLGVGLSPLAFFAVGSLQMLVNGLRTNSLITALVK